ncbi:MAG TPA: HIT domain-containing protein [Candidatus Binataceae bacterium]|jgi:ATP adenylyltransferase|nr:HIT domain-containing protein [Candidatus Binataceae bacterium]
MEQRGPEDRKPTGWRQLWAPWRGAYIKAARSQTARCIFCFGALNKASRRRRLVLYADPQAVVMLNRYPYNNGHLLIAPRRHTAELDGLTAAEAAALSALQIASVRILKQALAPHGFNLGANLGRVAGAGIADHLHWHAVPRWNGDTNFMPVLAQTRVASEHLQASFALLEPLFRQLQIPVS